MQSRELNESTAMSVLRLATCSINCSWIRVTESNEKKTKEETESISTDTTRIVITQTVQYVELNKTRNSFLE